MSIERKEQGRNNQGSKRTIIASLSAPGGMVLASSCCLPLAPFFACRRNSGNFSLLSKAQAIPASRLGSVYQHGVHMKRNHLLLAD